MISKCQDDFQGANCGDSSSSHAAAFRTLIGG